MRALSRYALIAAALCCAAPAAAAHRPRPVTIAQLIDDPDRYAMQTVRIRGQVDNCISFTCGLCPETMTRETLDAKQCLPLSFHGFPNEDNYDLADRATIPTAERMEETFRFATVTLDAFFDPTCMTNKDYSHTPPPKPNQEEIVTCSDRGTVLEMARVVTVHSRKSAFDGLVTGYDAGPLGVAEPADAAAMQAAFFSAYRSGADDEVRAFVLTSKKGYFDTSFDKQGLVCVCRKEECAGRWPSRYFAGFESPANPFLCRDLAEMKGVWTLLGR